MIPIHWLLRAKRWAQKPPSMRQAIFFAAIVLFCLALAGAEWLWGWPDWLTVNSPRRLP